MERVSGKRDKRVVFNGGNPLRNDSLAVTNIEKQDKVEVSLINPLLLIVSSLIHTSALDKNILNSHPEEILSLCSFLHPSFLKTDDDWLFSSLPIR